MSSEINKTDYFHQKMTQDPKMETIKTSTHEITLNTQRNALWVDFSTNEAFLENVAFLEIIIFDVFSRM